MGTKKAMNYDTTYLDHIFTKGDYNVLIGALRRENSLLFAQRRDTVDAVQSTIDNAMVHREQLIKLLQHKLNTKGK